MPLRRLPLAYIPSNIFFLRELVDDEAAFLALSLTTRTADILLAPPNDLLPLPLPLILGC